MIKRLLKTLESSLLIALALLVTACSGSNDPRYFDYSGSDGCSPPNLGHRLGGDLEQFSDNTIEGLQGIAGQQGSKCFKNWEFDLNESADGLVVFHDSSANGVPVKELTREELSPGVVTPAELLSQFSMITATKPIIIDLKTLRSESSLRQAKEVAIQLRDMHAVEIWFIASRESAQQMPGVCTILKPEFDLLLYSRGGKFCK